MRIDPSKITDWQVASKTRPITAKPLNTILADRTIVDKLLLDTLEGKEPLGEDVMICLGEAGDIWQQPPAKLLKKYKLISIDGKGWMTCEPLPDNAVNCVEVTKELVKVLDPANSHLEWISQKFDIIGQWGETVDGEKNVQRGTCGDFICQNQTDSTDVWIVRRKLFLNTYVIIPPKPKLPEPTEKQAACQHNLWKLSSCPPRHCPECDLLMWDAGD